jgi:SAM-dependent methyltransferase
MIETPAVAAAPKARVPGLEKRLTARLLADHVAPVLPRVGAALELAPGPNPLLPGVEGDFRRLAVDVELNAGAARRFDDARVGRAEALPLESESIDLVVARWVFEHVENGDAAVAELARVLRPGGVCAFITPNRRHPVFLANWSLQAALPFSLARRVAALGAGRAENSVYRAYYRLSTPAILRRLWTPHGLVHLDLVDESTYGLDLSFLTTRLRERKPFLVGRLEKAGAA